MTLARWSERSPEEAALFNPALTSVVLFHATTAYQTETGEGMPFELAFLVLPVVLVTPIRQRLPRQTRTSLPIWLAQNPDVRLQFPDLASATAPIVREAILFGCAQALLAVREHRVVAASRLKRGAAVIQKSTSDETRDIMSRASFMGRWYAAAGDSATVMALWGVRP